MIRKDHFSPDQAEMLRRVNSTSNLPNFSQPPRLVNHQEIRMIGNASGAFRPAIDRPAMDRSFSNPQLLSGSQLRHIARPIAINNGSKLVEIRQLANPLAGSRPNLIR